ncbi:hypothetical protein Ahu01nite_074820 [Winogradskya humida]|uniref:Lipoprotein with Yx(FWY)xxD motif n=2 Tax=Winogradskya humida TaxID=113566 RepID=A0ABQ4A0I8_9ACTN|nr:hypothetical protein Ahu01nite_074820 [Actinoplanes humidus]
MGSGEAFADAAAGLAMQAGTAKTSNAAAGTGDWAAPKGGVVTGDAAEEAQKWVQLTATRLEGLGKILVNGAGLTLYRFDEDTAKPSKATCNGECAAKWPPVTVKAGGKIFIAGVAKKDVGVVKRDDGALQVTVKGWPVYRFAKDVKAGDAKGQGVGDTWFGVRPDGGKAGVEATEPTTAPEQGNDQQGNDQQGNEQGDQQGNEQEQGDKQESIPAKRVVLFSGFSFNVFDDDAGSQVIEPATAPDGGCVNALDPGTASSIAFDGLVKVWTGADCTGESKELGAVDAENVGGIADLRDIDFNNKIQSVKLLG